MAAKKMESPFKYLRSALDNMILVKLKDGTEYVGKLIHCDGTMNLILTNCVEVREGGSLVAKYDKLLIRGSNILFISINPPPT